MFAAMRGNIRKTLTYLLATAVVTIFLAVAAEWFIEVAKDKGLYHGAGQQWDAVMGMIASTVVSGWVLYPLVLLAGFVGGMWFDLILKKMSANSSALSVTISRINDLGWGPRAYFSRNKELDKEEFYVGPVAFTNVSDDRPVTIEIYLLVGPAQRKGAYKYEARIEGSGRDRQGRTKGKDFALDIEPPVTEADILYSPVTLQPHETKKGYVYFIPNWPVGSGQKMDIDPRHCAVEIIDLATLKSIEVPLGNALIGRPNPKEA